MTVETKEIPRNAFQFATSQMKFAEGDAEQCEFSIQARSGEEASHPYWGRIIHDMKGMSLRKPTCPIDYGHREHDPIGVGTQFDASSEGLEVSGHLIVLEENDTADQVLRRGRAGFPYEGSIDWSGAPDQLELEYIPEEVSTEVNGRQFAGPGYVVRKWPLKAVSVVPFGTDSKTSAQFSDAEADNVSVRVFSQVSAKKEHEMADDNNAPTDDLKSPVGITPETLTQFSDAFGDQAMGYLQAGLSLDAAHLKFAQHRADSAEAGQAAAEAKLKESETQFKAAIDAEKTRADEAVEKLKQFGDGLGQKKPLESDSDDDADKKFSLFNDGKAVQKQG